MTTEPNTPAELEEAYSCAIAAFRHATTGEARRHVLEVLVHRASRAQAAQAVPTWNKLVSEKEYLRLFKEAQHGSSNPIGILRGIRACIAAYEAATTSAPAPEAALQELVNISQELGLYENMTNISAAPVAGWLRVERGAEARGLATLDPLFLLGPTTPTGYAATYEPLYAGRTPHAAPEAPTPSEWDVRGHLATALTCWHRLTEQEAAELVALFKGRPAPAPDDSKQRWMKLADERAIEVAELKTELARMRAAPAAVPVELAGIEDAIKEGGGFWRSCSGCHELNEGHATGPYSKVFKCALGSGCDECGGIGAIWDTTDYGAIADAMAESATQAGAAHPAEGVRASALASEAENLADGFPLAGKDSDVFRWAMDAESMLRRLIVTQPTGEGAAEITSYAVGEARVERVLQRTGSYKWAVRMLGIVLNKQGIWEHEPQPSNRDDKFFERCRFDTAQEAIRAAIAQQNKGDQS